MIMNAVVIEAQPGRLLVLDLDTRQRVVVNTQEAWRWRAGDVVRIWYDGIMTRSIPPQINAWGIAPAQANWNPSPCPPAGCPPVVFPPVVRPPVVFPPVVLPPIVRPPVIGPQPGPRPPRPPFGPRPPRPPRPGPGPQPR